MEILLIGVVIAENRSKQSILNHRKSVKNSKNFSMNVPSVIVAVSLQEPSRGSRNTMRGRGFNFCFIRSMESAFLDRVDRDYLNNSLIEYARVLKLRATELAPGAIPDLRDMRDAGASTLIGFISPWVYLIILGKVWIMTVIRRVRWRFQKIEVPETIGEWAPRFLDTDFPHPPGIDSNYHHEWRSTKEPYIL